MITKREIAFLYAAMVTSFAVVLAYFFAIATALFSKGNITVMHFNHFGEMYIEFAAMILIISFDVIALSILWRKAFARDTM